MAEIQLAQYAGEDSLPAHIRWQISSFIRQWWNDPHAVQVDAPIMNRAWNPVFFVMTQGMAVVGHAAVAVKDITHAGERFRLYGLCSVFAYPAFRKRGLGRRVMAAASDYIDGRADADMAILFTRKELGGFYGGAGGAPMEGMTVMIGRPAVPSLDYPMMRFVSARARADRPRFEEAGFFFGDEKW